MSLSRDKGDLATTKQCSVWTRASTWGVGNSVDESWQPHFTTLYFIYLLAFTCYPLRWVGTVWGDSGLHQLNACFVITTRLALNPQHEADHVLYTCFALNTKLVLPRREADLVLEAVLRHCSGYFETRRNPAHPQTVQCSKRNFGPQCGPRFRPRNVLKSKVWRDHFQACDA